MTATGRTAENASSPGLEERDVRALTEYLTVLDDVGRARNAEGLYLVVSQSGREYLVDAEQGACECEDHRYRDATCKHVRRVAFATGRRAIPTAAAMALDVDPSLGEHVEGDRRYVATDGGDRDAERSTPDRAPAGDRDAETDATERSWFVRDRDRNRVRAAENREAAERAAADLRDLGLDVELVRGDEITVEPVDEATAVELDDRALDDDPLEWLPEAFVDRIDGTPAINRKGCEVLAHVYDVDVETAVQVGPADTDHEYSQVKATATLPSGRRCEALASAYVERGDDPTVLLELADTRARKRAISIATGVGVVTVAELRSDHPSA